MQNFGMSILWFWLCYIVVTCVGIIHTILPRHLRRPACRISDSDYLTMK